MKRMNLMVAIFGLLIFSSFAMGLGQVELSTGFDNTLIVQAPYPNPPVVSNQPDNYWINIASFPTTNPAVGPAWVLHSPQASWWSVLLPNSRWISAWKTAASPSLTTVLNPAYTIFKKGFCLQRGFQNASLSFKARGDNNINAYLNTTLNPVLPPSSGQWNSAAPLQSLPSNPAWFRVGPNYLYVYAEDDGGLMGFDLSGTVSALGLLPTPAMGTNGSFAPCSCSTGPVTRSATEVGDNDAKMIREILKIAAAQRAARQTRQ